MINRASFLRTLERFFQLEASSGIALLIAAAAALGAANSSWSGSYHHVLEQHVGVVALGMELGGSIHFLINDVLMTIFFFHVGLEIRREMHDGELSDLRRATLPFAAAAGGMLAPALLYFAFNHGAPGTAHGWGIPMATDIAFAVGILALLGKRVPSALRILLLALAIIDDIGSILVIAIFYSANFRVDGVALAILGILGVISLRRLGVKSAFAYVVPAIVVWLGALRSGVHPTIAGVAIGVLTPAAGGDESPAARVQDALHPWVAFGIMPLFALANAGVTLSAGHAFAPSAVVLGVVVGLVIGKPLGILLASAIVTRAGLATLPEGIGFRQMLVLGLVAGIGFTMAIFIAALALVDPERLEEAKLAIFVASAVAGVMGLGAGRLLLPIVYEKEPRQAGELLS